MGASFREDRCLMDELEQSIRRAIKDRSEWEVKQQTWYQLRHGLIPRKSKPYPGAPDQKARLIDASIDKHKPFYVQQIYAMGQIAQFVPLQPDGMDEAATVAAWFDYMVKQRTNFEREAICAIDHLLQGGLCPVKVYWNATTKRLEFDACDPQLVIVPKGTEELHRADFLTHVLRMSEAQYRRNKTYNQDDELIKRLKGRGTGTADGQSHDESLLRAGLTCGRDDNEIVLWETCTRDSSGKITVKTRSPLIFDEQVREDFGLPYSEGVFAEGWFPFVAWRGEIISDKDYYAPRGQAEILAPHEVGMSKAWNYILEHMDFHSRPMFELEKGATMPNMANFRNGPGSIMPEGLKAVHAPPIPPALFEERNFIRQMAEYRIQAPDFGVMSDNGGKRTATEISAISGQTGQGVDLRARIFRLDLGDTYRMAWAILKEKARDSLTFVLDGEISSLGPEALSRTYEISPNGSAETWNKNERFAKAQARFGALQNNPYVKQGELVKDLLSADESGTVKRLYQEPEQANASEREEQNIELVLMTNRFAASVDPTDDDPVHLDVIYEWFPVRMQEQPPLDPITARLVFEHVQGHGEGMRTKKHPMLRAYDQKMKPISAALMQIAQPPQPNVVPMEQPQEALV